MVEEAGCTFVLNGSIIAYCAAHISHAEPVTILQANRYRQATPTRRSRPQQPAQTPHQLQQHLQHQQQQHRQHLPTVLLLPPVLRAHVYVRLVARHCCVHMCTHAGFPCVFSSPHSQKHHLIRQRTTSTAAADSLRSAPRLCPQCGVRGAGRRSGYCG